MARMRRQPLLRARSGEGGDECRKQLLGKGSRPSGAQREGLGPILRHLSRVAPKMSGGDALRGRLDAEVNAFESLFVYKFAPARRRVSLWRPSPYHEEKSWPYILFERGEPARLGSSGAGRAGMLHGMRCGRSLHYDRACTSFQRGFQCSMV